MPKIAAIITGLDNLPILKESVEILKSDSLINKIIVVDNDSKDGTSEWARKQKGIIYKLRPNNGAGPGRNTGLDLARKCDYYLMLDMGIRPLINGTKYLLDFLERRKDVDVIGVELDKFQTDKTNAHTEWPKSIDDCDTYRYRMLSLTAYCLARYKAFDRIRFCTEGPFNEAGWGVDDNVMAGDWCDKGIVVHATVVAKPYRRASGSFTRIERETRIGANQYGSTYEKRLIYFQQNYARYDWGEPCPDRIKIIEVGPLEETIKTIKSLHEEMRKNRQAKPWDHHWLPYRIIVKCPKDRKDFIEWAEPRRLRQHHGDTIIVNEEIIRRTKENEELWTGDFVLEII